jgi:ligand-binding SRPBCC domain-containing protein
MSVVHVTARIHAPMDVVWNTIMDPSRLGDWVTIHRSIRDVSSHPLRKGSTMEQQLHLRGVTFRVHWTVMAPPIRAPASATSCQRTATKPLSLTTQTSSRLPVAASARRPAR